ncbi:ferredoxin reductase domain-containing protein [Allokutzneria albata]|uniref:Uncharacterized protein n=1 Tax=Allokutzneria albata TaxID=211114 RepID=A0A1G9SAA9_ALLAB|nr:hypothetical protein [Allokutzneria albata]SDM32433.1 hypothetical protein SAMN04489726_1014 [Allokutzneria albata]
MFADDVAMLRRQFEGQLRVIHHLSRASETIQAPPDDDTARVDSIVSERLGVEPGQTPPDIETPRI